MAPTGTTARYLDRIGVDASGRPADLALLTELQVAHLVAVPFENLDVFHRRGVRTDLAWSLPKIVERRRGGWCFELNGAFGWLLGELGYAVDYVSCQVFGPRVGPAARPLRLRRPPRRRALARRRRLRRLLHGAGADRSTANTTASRGACASTLDGDTFRMSELALERRRGVTACRARSSPGRWTTFTPRSDYLQTEPGLAWTEKPFATRATATDGSRVTLRNGLLRIREGAGEFVDRPSTTPTSAAELLATALRSARFGLAATG